MNTLFEVQSIEAAQHNMLRGSYYDYNLELTEWCVCDILRNLKKKRPLSLFWRSQLQANSVEEYQKGTDR